MPGYDLHTHTTFSDGTTSPEDNVALALAAGLEGLAVTDHDNARGVERSLAAAAGTGLEVVPGVELSAELGGTSVHVLGFWFDLDDPELLAEMGRLANERGRRAKEIVRRFNDLGVPVTWERVDELAAGAPVGRPHIAQAVVDLGAAADVGEVFDRWLHDGGPAYVPKYAVDPVRAVGLIVAARGVAVLAHPGLYGPGGEGVPLAEVEAMVVAGLGGIEADHPDHTDEQRTRYRALADSLGLVVTGGSDFHGERKDLTLGQVTTERARVDALRDRVPASRGGGSWTR